MSRHYFNDMAGNWDETVSEKNLLKLKYMAERLNIAPGSTVLDMGTGTGVFLPFLLAAAGEKGRIVAVDFAEEMLKKARAKGHKGNIDYLCADVVRLPLDDEMFDVAVCYSCFPHFHDKPAALRELYRLVKPGGGLFICHTSSRANINEIHRGIPALVNDIIPDEAEMLKLMSAAGFAGAKVEEDSESYLCRARKPSFIPLIPG